MCFYLTRAVGSSIHLMATVNKPLQPIAGASSAHAPAQGELHSGSCDIRSLACSLAYGDVVLGTSRRRNQPRQLIHVNKHQHSAPLAEDSFKRVDLPPIYEPSIFGPTARCAAFASKYASFRIASPPLSSHHHSPSLIRVFAHRISTNSPVVPPKAPDGLIRPTLAGEPECAAIGWHARLVSPQSLAGMDSCRGLATARLPATKFRRDGIRTTPYFAWRQQTTKPLSSSPSL